MSIRLGGRRDVGVHVEAPLDGHGDGAAGGEHQVDVDIGVDDRFVFVGFDDDVSSGGELPSGETLPLPDFSSDEAGGHGERTVGSPPSYDHTADSSAQAQQRYGQRLTA